MRATIHIGLHKSGSTAIQKYCGLASARLLEAGCLYPTGLFPNYPDQHSELAALLSSGSDAALEDLFDRLMAAATQANAKHVFLSGEDLCTGLGEAAVRRLHQMTAARFEETSIVLVLRNKTDYLFSHYNHFLRHMPGRVGLAEFKAHLSFSPVALLDRWGAVFGSDAVETVSYDAADGPPFLARFVQTVLGVDPVEDILRQCQRTNASFDIVSACLVNDAVKAFPELDIQAINAAHRQAFGALKGSLPLIEADIAAMLDASFADEDWAIPALAGAEPKALQRPPLDRDQALFYLSALATFCTALHDAVAEQEPASDGGKRPGRRDVVDAYRVLLDRLPESDQVVERAAGYKTVEDLRLAVLQSEEFRGKNPRFERLNTVSLAAPRLAIDTAAPEALDRLFTAAMAKTWPDASGPMGANASDPAEWDLFQAIMARVGLTPRAAQRAVVFGDRTGRMLLPLSEAFERVEAAYLATVDIGRTERFLTERALQSVCCHPVTADAPATAPGFDLWYSRTALQALPPPVMEVVLAAGLAGLTPGGIAVFQLPTYATGYAFSVEAYLSAGARPEYDMHCLAQPRVLDIIAAAGCRLREVREDNAIDLPRRWVSNAFAVDKPPS